MPWLSTACLAVLVLLPARAPAQVVAAHPRMILDAPTLATLRQRAQANTAEWKSLKSWCDKVLPGQIYPPVPDKWGDPPNIDSNYQGHGYIEATFNLGLCYQVMKGINATAALAYGNKLAQLLDVISKPEGNATWVNPCTDAGYGIRNFGVALGIGYDWAYDRLGSALKNQVIAAANDWVDSFENDSCSFYQRGYPNNYHAGYLHAKAAIALGTWGDNASAPAMWSNWLDTRFRQQILPYFNRWFDGGGWLEGFANYAPSTILHLSLPAREVKTATGIDLVHPTDGSAAYAYPVDSALYAMHFAWPSRGYFDDRDTNRSNGNTEHPPGTNTTGMYVHMLGALDYYGSPQAAVMRQYLDEVRSATGNFSPAPAWQTFLFVDPGLAPAPLASLPRSYFAPGIGAVAARSDWSTGAAWMSLRAAPYIEDPNHGEEYTDQGSLALVRGATPLLVNASGRVVHEPGGNCGENRVYMDNGGSFNGSQYQGNGQLYNIFYVRHMSGTTLLERFGQTKTTPAGNPRTTISAFQDAGSWVYAKAAHLEDMYRDFDAGPAVASWSREILFLRPDRFVVYDRTRKGQAGYDQYLAFAFPAAPANATAPTGQKRITVTYDGTFAGTASFVYPAGASLSTAPVYPTNYVPSQDWGGCKSSGNPVKAWQTQVRPANSAQDQRWLSVFDLAGSAAGVADTTPLQVTSGAVLGVVLDGSGSNDVMVAGSGDQDSILGTAFAYTLPAEFARHVVIGVAPGSHWSVAANRSGDTLAISATPGGSLVASSAGVLEFVVDAAGEVRSGDTLFFSGFDR